MSLIQELIQQKALVEKLSNLKDSYVQVKIENVVKADEQPQLVKLIKSAKLGPNVQLDDANKTVRFFDSEVLQSANAINKSDIDQFYASQQALVAQIEKQNLQIVDVLTQV